MRKFVLYITFLATICVTQINAQITVSTAQTPQQLIQDVLLGSGVSVSNITFSGKTIQRGSFVGTSNIGMEEGILLSTGYAVNAVLPNPDNDDFPSIDLGRGGDATLTNLAGFETFDAAVLEFDFIPKSDTIRFYYVFASEEYPEYVCSSYNDVFGFFLSGPKPGGGNYVNKNLAIIPNTNLPVAINSINPGVSGSPAEGCDPNNCLSLSYQSLYVNNTQSSITYDGFTKLMEASAVVVACQPYHIKLAIADGADGKYDSGVFLQAKSFSSPAFGLSSNASTEGSVMVEGCGAGEFTFTRGGDINNEMDINFLIKGTATNGIDYVDLNGNPIANNITFPAGQNSVTLNINPINDSEDEADETIIIQIPQTIDCSTDTAEATIYIKNVNPLQIQFTGDTVICTDNNESSTLKVSFLGGFGPFDFIWENGEGDSTRVVAPTVPTTYSVSIEDSCGNESAVKSITVYNECEIITSNVVTPNGDGINDKVTFKNIDLFPNSKLEIFNRWGKKIYENSNYANDWEPTDQAEGTYFYILKQSKGVEIDEKEYHGTITILK